MPFVNGSRADNATCTTQGGVNRRPTVWITQVRKVGAAIYYWILLIWEGRDKDWYSQQDDEPSRELGQETEMASLSLSMALPLLRICKAPNQSPLVAVMFRNDVRLSEKLPSCHL